MSRQHCPPLLVDLDQRTTTALTPLSQHAGEGAVSEADIQALVHAHPGSLPIQEIDPLFTGAVPICRELNTPAGPIDNLLVTPTGLPVIVECKLWRNPEGRREVVGQILDYAKELSRWSASDLQREVGRRLKREGNALLDIVREEHPGVDEMEFNDALTSNLRRGRFLLLIVGDGIREGVEAIAEYLQAHAGLHFSLGLVELPIFVLPDGRRIVTPRVLARTTVVTRNVVAVPEGFDLQEEGAVTAEKEVDPDRTALQDAQQAFWAAFLASFNIRDPEQSVPKPARMGYIAFSLPAPGGSAWLTVYRDRAKSEVGVFLSASRNSAGEFAMQSAAEAWDEVGPQLGGTAKLTEKGGRPRIIDAQVFANLDTPDARQQAFEWLGDRVNTFIDVLRPRVRSAATDYAQQQG